MNFEIQALDSASIERFSYGYIANNHKVANLQNSQGRDQHDGRTTEVIVAPAGLFDLMTSLVLWIMTVLGVITFFRYLVQVVWSVLESLLRIS